MIRERLAKFRYWPQSITAALVVLAFAGYRYVAYYDTSSTDAEVTATVIPLAPLVAGSVVRVAVAENQSVKKGDVLLEIDKTAYVFAQEAAKADFTRVTGADGNSQSTDPDVLAAEAALFLANYRVEQTTLRAPRDGLVHRVLVSPGQYVAAGQQVMDLVDIRNSWIEARYRETAIRLIKPGDKAVIRLSMYPGTVFTGHVDRILWGANMPQSSGGAIVPQPAQDWIKVARRFPVRILVDDAPAEFPLRLGASASTTTMR